MKITRLYLTKNKKRVNIEIDDEFALAVEQNTIAKFNIYKDKILYQEEIDALREYDRTEFGYRRAIDYLSKRQRSSGQIREYLKKLFNKKLDSKESNEQDQITGIIENIIEKLTEHKFLDDDLFAQEFIAFRIKQGKKSMREISAEMRKFGIDKDTVQKILPSQYTEVQQIDNVVKLILKKIKASKLSRLEQKEKERKIIEYLQRKGFEWALIKKALEITKI